MKPIILGTFLFVIGCASSGTKTRQIASTPAKPKLLRCDITGQSQPNKLIYENGPPTQGWRLFLDSGSAEVYARRFQDEKGIQTVALVDCGTVCAMRASGETGSAPLIATSYADEKSISFAIGVTAELREDPSDRGTLSYSISERSGAFSCSALGSSQILFLKNCLEVTSEDQPAPVEATSFKKTGSALAGQVTDEVFMRSAIGLLASKCVRYSLTSLSLPLPCYGAASDTIRLLNAKGMNIHKSFDADYGKMIQTETATAFLTLLSEGMQKALDLRQKFDVWNTTLAFFNGNKVEALKWLAVMFHETFTSSYTNCYITTNGTFIPKYSKPPCTTPNHVLHTKAGYLFRELADENPDLISLYPAEGVPRGAGWYHFYIPAYLTAALIERGYTPRLASYMLTELNASYEYQYFNTNDVAMDSSDSLGFGYSEVKEKWSTFKNSFPPSSIDLNPKAPKSDGYYETKRFRGIQNGIRHGLNATYMGYLATQWVIGNTSPMTKDQFIARFSASPNQFFRDILK